MPPITRHTVQILSSITQTSINLSFKDYNFNIIEDSCYAQN